MADIQTGSNQRLVIFIDGQPYRVPGDITILTALEYAGFQLKRGCGCRGGVCGACATVYRLPGDNRLYTCLACQTVVQPDMQLSLMRYFPVNRATYAIADLAPTGQQVIDLYPEITRCMGCNTCTQACPMDINAMGGISAILKGDIEAVAQMSMNCIMCGLCAGRCPAGLSPYLYFLLCRRLYGRHVLAPFVAVPPRIAEIKDQQYTRELDRLMALDTEELKKIYQEHQQDKRIV